MWEIQLIPTASWVCQGAVWFKTGELRPGELPSKLIRAQGRLQPGGLVALEFAKPCTSR